MRRTVIAVAALSMLVASACGEDDSQTSAGDDATLPAAQSASSSDEADGDGDGDGGEASGGGAGADAESTTTTTGDGNTIVDGAHEEARERADDRMGEGPPGTACGGAVPDRSALRGRTGAVPPECLGPEPGPQPEPELGTGDVQVTLRWDSPADVDLHVFEPNGDELWFGNRGPSGTGGQLDVDSNVGCVEEASVENVFWPEGESPEGDFTVEVTGYQVDGCGSGDYTLTVKVEGEEVLSESGTVGEDETDTYEFSA